VTALAALARSRHPRVFLRVHPDSVAARRCYAGTGFEPVAPDLAAMERGPANRVCVAQPGHVNASGAIHVRPRRGAQARHRGVEGCNRKVGVRLNAVKAAGRAHSRRRCPVMASTSRIVHDRRYQKVLKDIREAVSDRGRGVRSRVRGRPRGRPEPQEMIRDAVPGFRDL
jgi:hypothetical protein